VRGRANLTPVDGDLVAPVPPVGGWLQLEPGDNSARVRDAATALLFRPAVVRAVVALCQIVATLYTWNLWQAREDPPNLPAVGGLAGVSFGVLMVVSAALAIVMPRAGAATHAVVLLFAMFGDQFRIQPEFVSLAVVLLALAFGPVGRTIGLAHLASLWLWAGLNKALSPSWPVGGAGFIARSLNLAELRPLVALGLPVFEFGLGLAACVPRLRRHLMVPAAVLHLAILGTLMLARFNLAVWPWNLALALAAPALLRRQPTPAASTVDAPSAEPAHEPSTIPGADPAGADPTAVSPAAAPESGPGNGRADRRSVAVIWAVFLLLPAGFYLGLVDTYLAHNLYSDNTAGMQWCSASGRCPAPESTEGRTPLRVPTPPEERIFVAWFEARCAPGDTLLVRVPEVRIPRANAGSTRYTCPRS